MPFRNIRTTASVLITVLCCIFSLSFAYAQTNTTGLSGTVTDPTGAVVPGANVTITNKANGFARSEPTKAQGEYSFDQIPPGKYTVSITAAGFSSQEQALELLVATPIKVTFKLTVGNSEQVVVETSTPALNTEDATLGKAFNSTQVQDLPYQANNVLSLLSLQPGALSLDPGGTNGGLNTDTRTGIINGARQDQTNVTLDGVDNNDQNNGYAFTGVLRATRDSVQEFRVVTGNANADAGRSSGAQVSLLTRSGTNNLHGSAYYYYRDPAAASNSWFLKQSQLNTNVANRSAKVLQHTFGATLGGPIFRNKLFAFGAYEGFKQASNVVVTQTVPSALNPAAGLPKTADGYGGLVTGNVSYTAASGTVTLTPADMLKMDATGRGQDAAAIAYYNQFPRANSSSVGDGLNTGGYVFTSPNPISQITNVVRLDYNVNSRNQLFVRGNLQSDNTTGTFQFDNTRSSTGTALAAPVPNNRVYGNNKGIAVGWISTISNNLTNNLRYGFIRQGVATRGAINTGYVTISGLSSLYPSASSSLTSVYTEPVNNYADDFTWNKGRHTIQFGANLRTLDNNRYSESTLYSNGSITVSLLNTAGVSGQGQSFDPVLYGYPAPTSTFRTSYNNAILAAAGVITSATSYSNYTLSGSRMSPILSGTTLPTRHFRNLEQEYYVQDQWKLTPRLTLTAGLRYVYLGVPYETNGQQLAPTVSAQDFLNSRVAGANSGSAYNTRLVYVPAGSANGAANYWKPQNLNFAPRVAFAWASEDAKTSVRGGYALSFDHFGDAIINAFDASGGFKLNSSNLNSFGTIDASPRFTSFSDPHSVTVAQTALTLPYTPPDNSFNFTGNINRTQHTPYSQNVNFSIQRAMKHNMTATVSYVGHFGRHILASLDAGQPNNLYDPASGQTYFQAMTAFAKLVDQKASVSSISNTGYFQNIFPKATYQASKTSPIYTGAQAVYAKLAGGDRGNETDIIYAYDVPSTTTPLGGANGESYRFFYPQYGSIFTQSTMGTSNYNALQASFRQQLSRGLSYDFNYSYSKSMDLGSSPERSGTSNNRISNSLNPAGNYGPSDFDVRHNITANYIASFPFGRGQRFFTGMNSFWDNIVGGFQLTGIVHYNTALPWTATSSVYGTNFAASTQIIKTGTANTSGHHRYIPSGTASYETAFDATTPDTPAGATASFRYAYPGEAGQRNNLRADGYFDMDNGIAKSFHVYGEHKLRVEAEVFNVLNTVRFNTLTTNYTSSSFGKYSSLLVNPRQMQFSAKYNF